MGLDHRRSPTQLFLRSGTRRSAICRFCFPVPCNSPSHDGRISVPKQWNGGQIGVPKQWNGGHVGVPNQSFGSRTHFLCKRFFLFQNICRDAGHVSKKALWQQCEIKLIVYVILCYISPMKYFVFKRKKVKLWLYKLIRSFVPAMSCTKRPWSWMVQLDIIIHQEETRLQITLKWWVVFKSQTLLTLQFF